MVLIIVQGEINEGLDRDEGGINNNDIDGAFIKSTPTPFRAGVYLSRTIC